MSSESPPAPSDVGVTAGEKLDAFRAALGSVILGKADAIDLITIALLADGSVLMEDIPGVGKTTLAKAVALALDLDFRRVQFTPDLMPSDIVGGSVFRPETGELSFRPGPIFCNVLLADEINRASPRTQSALLEAMAETQATVEGASRPLPRPFFVVATQNPVDFHGTYPLPEAQLDRFLIYVRLGYPRPDVEVGLLTDQGTRSAVDDVRPVLTRDDLIDLQAEVRDVAVDGSVASYMVALVNRTREDERLELGVSPRGSLMLVRAAQAAAFLGGRRFVTPDDVQRVAGPVLAHRLILSSKAKFGGVVKADVIADVVDAVPVPG
ncbi:MAG: MoxR family ATPase [Planctomycetota bacterium]